MPALRWTECRDGFQCATARVPLDYDRPTGASILLSLIKLPAGGPPGQRLGSLFLNPGGPGGSGVDVVRYLAPFAPLSVRARYDIVGVDPRGILRSTPLRCFATFDQALSVLPPFAFPVTTRQENRWRLSDQALAGACASHGGAIRDHMSTADVARDFDLLRRAVGDPRFNYLGFSYGSMIGSTYANLFPRSTGRMVLDGVIDPVAWTSGGAQARTVPVLNRMAAEPAAQATLHEFFRLCDEPGSQCSFAGDAGERYAELAARLRRSPIVIDDPAGGSFRITYADVVAFTFGAMYDPYSWPFLADILTELEALSPAAATSAAALQRRLLGSVATQEEYPNFVEGYPGVLCSDSTNPRSVDVWRRTAAEADREGYFGRGLAWYSSICQSWPASAGQDSYAGPWTARTASTVLVVGNSYDPITPGAGAVAVSRLLPNSRLLSYTGWGHSAFLRGNFCVDNAVTTYLAYGRVPRAGATCSPAGSPFGPTEASTLAIPVIGTTLSEPVRRAIVEALDGR